MKRIYAIIIAFGLAVTVGAQTLNVKVGSITYLFPAAQTGDMPYTDGNTVNIMGKVFSLSDIDKMTVDNTEVTDNAVNVCYNGSTATVTVAGNVAKYLTPTVSGAHVSIEQSEDVEDEITYILSGSSNDGEFYTSGSFKATVELNGVTLKNSTPCFSGAAIHIQNGKRIKVKVITGTTNTLEDAANGSQKGCLYIKGHAEFAQKGTLNVIGNTKHGIKTGEYMTLKNAVINITSAASDGISCNEYFLMESGSVSISGVGDDGIQCEIDGTTATGETTNHEEEDSGNIYIQGGSLSVSTTSVGSKGINATGSLVINENSTTTVVNVTNTGGVDTSNSSDLTSSACLKSDVAVNISGGTLTLTNSGQGGRAINSDGTITISGGVIDAKAQGANYGSSGGGGPWGGNSSSPHKYSKCVKADGNITISGGTLNVYSKNHEGLETKGLLDISGGQVYAQAKDDAINSASHMTITSGYVCGYSTGNDGLDANGNCYIKGGVIYAICSGTPEVAVDANTERGYKLYVTGGTIVAIGGLERGSSLTQSCYQSSSWSRSTWYAITVGNDTFAFKTPSSGGSGIVVSGASKPTLKSGVTVTDGSSIFGGMGYMGASFSGGSSVSLTSYSGGGGGRW